MPCASRLTVKVVCAVVLFSASVGCAGKARYQAAVAENRANIHRLHLGMTSNQIRSVMGEGVLVTYRRIRLSNPWRSEAFLLRDEDNTKVGIFYYLTEPQRKWRTAEDRELTPVVLENDQVVGWGWSYLRRNTDRYAISVPLEQR